MTIASWNLATSYLHGLYKLFLLVTVLHGIAKDMAKMCINLYISVQCYPHTLCISISYNYVLTWSNKLLSRLSV